MEPDQDNAIQEEEEAVAVAPYHALLPPRKERNKLRSEKGGPHRNEGRKENLYRSRTGQATSTSPSLTHGIRKEK